MHAVPEKLAALRQELQATFGRQLDDQRLAFEATIKEYAHLAEDLSVLSPIFQFVRGLGADRKSLILGVWAAPAGWKTHPTGGPLRGRLVGLIFLAGWGRPEPTIDDLRSAPNPEKLEKWR